VDEFRRKFLDNEDKEEKYKLLCPRGTQTCALAVANIAHELRTDTQTDTRR